MKTNRENVVWDLPTRLFHWLIALPVLINFILDGEEKWHHRIGYVALTALFFRLFWGFITNSEARFSKFPLSWNKIKNYNKSIPSVGHNPIASWTYIFIWLIVAALGISGYMMGLDAYWGEEWLEELHEIFSKIMKVLVLMHFTGIIMDSIKFRRKTWLGMITGKK